VGDFGGVLIEAAFCDIDEHFGGVSLEE